MTVEVIEEEGSVVPAPPPPPVQEHSGENFNPNRSRGLYRIWNIAAVFGPISQNDAYLKVSLFQGAWQEYMRYHPGVHRDDAERLRDVSNRWYFDHEIEIGRKHGYLRVASDGALTIGTCPPEHNPPTEDAIREMLHRDESIKAITILRNKTGPARMLPTTTGRAALKKDLKDKGQLFPITRWKDGGDWIIVDGHTRLEILDTLGIEPFYRELSEDLTALEVLIERVKYEMHVHTSKDPSKEARDAYIAELARQGFNQTAIAQKVGVSRQRVGQILSAMKMGLHRRQDPPPMEVIKEWVRLKQGGWSLRDIAEDYVWGKDTVSKYTKQWEESEAEAQANADEESSEESEATIIDLTAAIQGEKEQASINASVSKLTEGAQPTSAAGKSKKAKEVEEMEAAIKSSGGGTVNLINVIKGNRPSIRATIFYSESIRKTVIKALRDLGYTVTEP